MIRAAVAFLLMILVTAAGAADEKKAKTKTVTGIVKGVDVEGRTLTIAPAKGAETSYSVTKNAKITVKGKDGKKLEDVTLNLQATLTLNADEKVTAITADRKKK